MTSSANSEGRGVASWSSDAWRADVVAWIDRQLDAAGIQRTGEIEQTRIRTWSTVMTVPTSEGMLWFKAASPETSFEVALYPLLQRYAPNAVLEGVAADVERGWLLLPDGGVHLGDVAGGAALVDAMVIILPRYAELQRALAPEVDAMLVVGVADMRPAIMPRRFDEALTVTGEYVESHGSAEDRATWKRIEEMGGTVLHWCERLVASPVSLSLDHNDLHPRNVLVPGAAAAGDARFYDWGDGVVAHPFSSMLVALRFMQDHLGAGLTDPAMLRMRDAYLEVFGDVGPHAELVETLEVACHIGKIARALVWNRALGMLSSEEAGDFAGAPLYWLAELLEESYLGSTGH